MRSRRSSSVTCHSFCNRGYNRAKKFNTWFCPDNTQNPRGSGRLNPAAINRDNAARSAAKSRVEYRVAHSGSIKQDEVALFRHAPEIGFGRAAGGAEGDVQVVKQVDDFGYEERLHERFAAREGHAAVAAQERALPVEQGG